MAGGYVRTANATIANKVITGDVTFAGSGLTLRNVRVTGTATFRGDDVTITDSEFGAVVLSGTARLTATRIDVFGASGKDGIHITSDTGPATAVVIADSWIHNPVVTSTTRYEGVVVRGVDGLTLRNTLVDLGAYTSQHHAALFLEHANGGNRNVTVTGSRLLGGTYVLASTATNVQVTGSVLGNGATGYLAPSATGITAFTGNTTPAGAQLSYTGGTIR